MDSEEYRKRGKEMIDYIADYLDNIRQRRVFPDVSPGYLRLQQPDHAPEEGESWENIFGDVEKVIMPGITHWQSPYMHAYFPALNSYPSLLGDMLADAIGCLGFTWASSPACTELETLVMDWLGKLINLPVEFLHSNQQTKGGGVIQTTSSESTFVCLLAARTNAIQRVKAINPELEDADINGRLVGYCSEQAHSSVEKAGLIGLVKMRLLPVDDSLSLRGDTLQEAINKDREDGLLPFFLCATLGTTGACAFDNLTELGVICQEEDIWMHIDAAYAGTAFMCPEFRHFMNGIEYASSFAFNPSKWMMVHFDCTAMWVKDSGALHRTFNIQPLYLKHENTGAAIDYMHWQIPLSKRFRALKLWFVLRSFGKKGLQEHIRKGVYLATEFEKMVFGDDRFEIPAKRHLGMVVFRLKGDNELTEILLKRINRSGKLHMVPASIKGKYIIRYTVTSQYTTISDITRDWSLIQSMASEVLSEETLEQATVIPRPISAAGQMKREGLVKKDFGISLILSNVPMSPKFINGSFAALFEANDIIVEFAKNLGRNSIDLNGRPIRLSPRKRLKEQCKQYSFDLCLIPHTRRNLYPSKQASLDSKIEEIFDTSIDSDPCDTDTEASFAAELEERATNEKAKAGISSDDDKATSPSGDCNRDDITKQDQKTEVVNGVPPLYCKKCGSVIEYET